jgi:amidase
MTPPTIEMTPTSASALWANCGHRTDAGEGDRRDCGYCANPGGFEGPTVKRIARNHTVPPQRRYKVLEPVATVELDEPFVVETINFRTPIIRSPADANPAAYREREETGPIFVNGIAPGDVLAIHILDIRPEGHASGGWWRDPKENAFLPIADGRVQFPGNLSVPVRMMIGDIYVTPDGWPPANPWDNGGNMDFKDIAAGNTLLLRAILPGGLLVLGDCHAAQGDGEILGLAAECAAEVTLRITKGTRLPVERPTIFKPHSFVCVACRRDYAEARDLAVADAKRLLAKLTGCTEEEAYLFVTTVGDLRNGAVWGMGKTEPAWVKTLPVVVGVEVPMESLEP